MEIAAEILAHYAGGQEHARLTSRPSLELLRTGVLLERFLPAPPARVLDIGGASGVYASWLGGRGYQVHLIDPVPLHREQAMADGRFSVASGDARHLAEDDGSYDAVLLLGPLYHLTDRTDPGRRPRRGPPRHPARRHRRRRGDLQVRQHLRRVLPRLHRHARIHRADDR